MKLWELFSRETVVPELRSPTRDGTLKELLEALVAAGRLEEQDCPAVLEALIKRECQGSTGFGKGVAVPHCQHQAVRQMAVAVGRSADGLDFEALDKAPVYSVVLLLSPPNDQDSHLQAMEVIFRHLQQGDFRKMLRQADMAEKLMRFVAEEQARAEKQA